MLNLGLNKAQLNQLLELLVSSHRIVVDVSLMDLSHKHLQPIGQYLLSGQVNIDSDGEDSTRTAELELLDPDRRLKFDSEVSEDGSYFFARMIRVTYIVQSVDRKTSFRIPIFTGPVDSADRSGPTLNLKCVGKEKLSMSQVWKGKTFKKGQLKTTVIKQILTELGGEAPKYMNISSRKAKLPAKLSINQEKTAWRMAQQLAGSMRCQLFYNGYGIAVMRGRSNKAVYTFRDKGAVLTSPQASYNIQELSNAIEVVGGKPKGSKKKVTARIVAPRDHPLSPFRMGRFGNPRYIPETIQDDSIKSVKEAKQIAKQTLDNRLIESLEVAFDSLPIPMLEEGDVCRVSTADFTGTFRLTKMSIPLVANGSSSIGYLKRVTPKRRITGRPTRRKRRKKKRN